MEFRKYYTAIIGSPYANSGLELICANLGIHLIHAKPYSPKRKAEKSKGALGQ